MIPPGEPVEGAAVDPLKYQRPADVTSGSAELMTVKVRYKQPAASVSQMIAVTVADHAGDPTATLGFAAAVAEYGMLLATPSSREPPPGRRRRRSHASTAARMRTATAQSSCGWWILPPR